MSTRTMKRINFLAEGSPTAIYATPEYLGADEQKKAHDLIDVWCRRVDARHGMWPFTSSVKSIDTVQIKDEATVDLIEKWRT